MQIIIAFLNTDGGDLIIGIQEKPFKKIYGVETDFKFLGLNDWDEWNRKTTSMITTQIGDKAIRLVKLNTSKNVGLKTLANTYGRI